MLRPILGTVKDMQDLDHTIHYPIRYNVGRSRDDQLTGTFPPADSASARESAESARCLLNSLNHARCCARIFRSDVTVDVPYVRNGVDKPSDFSAGQGLACPKARGCRRLLTAA